MRPLDHNEEVSKSYNFFYIPPIQTIEVITNGSSRAYKPNIHLQRVDTLDTHFSYMFYYNLANSKSVLGL